MTTRSVAVTAISDRRWLETSTDLPSLARRFINCRIHTIPSGSKPFDGLIEEQDAGIAEQRAGDPEPLRHAQRERSSVSICDLGQTHLIQDGVDPPDRGIS